MTRILFNTISQNEHYNGDCDLALVEITQEDAQRILRRIHLVAEMMLRDDRLCYAEFSAMVDFYNMAIEGDPWIPEGIEIDEYLIDPDFEIPEAAIERTEGKCLVIPAWRCRVGFGGIDSIWWKARPKHGDFFIETHVLRLAIVSLIANGDHVPRLPS